MQGAQRLALCATRQTEDEAFSASAGPRCSLGTQLLGAGPTPDESTMGDMYRYTIEYFTRDGSRLGEVAVEPDFQPAREWTLFRAARRGRAPLVTAMAAGDVSPLWDDDLGAPYVSGIRVATCGGEDVEHCDLSSAFSREVADAAVAFYRESGELETGESYCYRVRAYPAEEVDARDTAAMNGMRVEAAEHAISLAESVLDGFLARSAPQDTQNALDAPVFVANEVLAETLDLAERAGEFETGGVLVGRLHRDRVTPELFVEIAAQIPARHATAGRASFEFTPETWAAAHAAIALRGRDELILGWWHSHPRFCRNCPAERWRTCAFARPFFSPEDVHLHRTCFPQAYQQALLISDLPEAGHTPALFGWRAGQVSSRGFRVLTGEERSR